jgi:Rrf2 family protein
MLSISRQTDYAARLVLHLACQEPGALVAISRIAEERLLPVPYARRILGALVAAGILSTERGSAGGVRLARPAKEITLLDIVRAVEGEPALNRCLEADHGCPLASGCPVRPAWAGVTRSLVKSLAAVRFDALASATAGHRAAHRRPKARAARRKTERRSRWTS